MFTRKLKQLSFLLFSLSIISCQQRDFSPEINQNTLKKSHNIKTRLYIRNDNFIAGKIPVSHHEKRAQKYSKNYFIEGKTTSKKVALTFDDGPSMYTTKIINKLNSYNIKATFFMVGTAIKKHPELVKSIHQQGHLVANHSWDHSNANEHQSIEKYWENQILATNDLLEKITGVVPKLFRPPFGSTTDKKVEKLIEKKMKTVIWSIDTQDWNDDTNTTKNIASLAIKHIHPESIILMHDGGGNRQGTVNALDEIIQHYRQLDYQFVTVDEIINSY
ncbi:MAG: polysaccharide deacetylase family protein [Colwelliaceae bacterium]|nr:polysaccharide deacetylase family protein [Colwelliaceae bacterium]